MEVRIDGAIVKISVPLSHIAMQLSDHGFAMGSQELLATTEKLTQEFPYQNMLLIFLSVIFQTIANGERAKNEG